MARSSAFQSAAKRIESGLQPLKDKYTSKVSERDGLEQSLRDRSTVLKAEELAQQKEKYYALDSEIRDINYTVTKESDRLQREILEPVMKRLKGVIEEIAKSQGYDLVLYANQIFYFSESVDLTPLVLQSLDRGEGMSIHPDPAVPEIKPSAKSSDSSSDKPATSSRKSTRSRRSKN